MVTIKDIANRAGVAQGTVSNVLNGKGNVRSEKIRRVLEAAHELGYIPNERAALLRKGPNNSLAVIMPSPQAKQYAEFYSGFKHYAQSHGFSVTQHLTRQNTPSSEEEAFMEISPLLVKGIACLSIAAGTVYEDSVYKERTAGEYAAGAPVLFVEHKPSFEAPFISFDYEMAGRDMARKALERRYSNVCLMTGSLHFSNERDFYRGFMQVAEGTSCRVTHIQTDLSRRYQHIIQLSGHSMPQAFFISDYGFAESVKDICATFFGQDMKPDIFTVSPTFTMPENDFTKYEMNYRQLGKIAAETLIRQAVGKADSVPSRILEGSGFRDWYSNIITSKTCPCLNILSPDSPEGYIMQSFSRLYTHKSGIPVNVCIFSYDEIYEAFNSFPSSSNYDVIRMDVTWLSWFSEKLLKPLRQIDPDICQCFSGLLDGTAENYAVVHGEVCALPSTPSVQILFYRKDLFESPICRRLYFEQFKTELRPPQTFDEFNRIAAFFTKKLNPTSPVEYGATVTMGSTGVAGSEYLARLFARQENLYDGNREIHLDSPAALDSLRELVDLKRCTAPVHCSWWTDTARAFASGNYAMSILYSNYASGLLDHASRIAGNIGYAMVPGSNPLIGGGSLGVSRFSRYPKEALSFIKWMCSEPISSAAALLGSTSSCRLTYENYEVVNLFPWMNLAKKCFPLSKGERIPRDAGIPFDERKFLSILGMAVKNAYSNVATPEEALRFAQEQFASHFQTRF